MEHEGLVALGGVVPAVLVVGATAIAIWRRKAAEAGSPWIWVLVPAAITTATWFVFTLDIFLNALGDYESAQLYASPYGEYRAIDRQQTPFLFAGTGYALLAGMLAIAALAAHRRRDGLLIAFAALTCGAVALPLLIPSMLSHT